MPKEQKVPFMTNLWNGIKNNRIVQAEKENLTSVRTKLTYLLCLVWVVVNGFILSNIFEATKMVEPSSKVLLLEKAISVFYVDSFIFMIMIMVYVLKRTNFTFKAWGIELNMSENTKNNENKTITQPPVQ